MINLQHGDCLELMKEIPSGSIDMVLTDPPYGVTKCKWDSVIDFDLMWEQLQRVTKKNGAIILFGSEPFSSALRMSNVRHYRYDWIWKKQKPTNFFNAKKQPLKEHESLSVFYKSQPLYNPQGTIAVNINNGRKNKGGNLYHKFNEDYVQTVGNYPRTILSFSTDGDLSRIHPTQKPVALLEYLIKTYTQENEVVLDFTMGSGSTGVACINTNRKFIGIEKDDEYFYAAKKRIDSKMGEGLCYG